MKIVIVDENDQLLGSKERNSLKNTDIYRVSGLWLTNPEGEILLAQRSFSKKHDPGKWGPAAAGTIEEGETYKDNIIKEAEEELGLKNLSFTEGPKLRMSTDHQYFVQWFTSVIDKRTQDIKIQQKEVESVRWMTKEQLIRDFNLNPELYLKGAPHWIKIFCR